MNSAHQFVNSVQTRRLCPATVRQTIVQVSYASGHGHLPSCFSVVEILTVLYEHILRIDPKNPTSTERDFFIFSKGHAAAAIFAVLAHAGFYSRKTLVDTYAASKSLFGCHPDRLKVPGIEASTGSLGHGLPFAVGWALGLKMRRKPNRVFVLIGDGEANEGSVWESSMVAAHHHLEHLVGIVDFNQSQQRCLPLTRPAEKWASFGWRVMEVDGHSTHALRTTLTEAAERPVGVPTMVIAQTVKGKGVSFIERDMYAWHHRCPTADEFQQIMEELREDDEEAVCRHP
jgi:transketolase